MTFGELPVAEAEGALLAHSVKREAIGFKKGRLLSRADIEALVAAGVETVFAARLGPDDVPEDEAASLIARAIAGAGVEAQEPFTGRANLHASHHGLAVIDQERVRALNRIHESLTVATAAPFEQVEARQLVATVKVIPFAVPKGVLEEALQLIGARPLVRVAAFTTKNVGLIITRLANMKASLIEKSEAAMKERIGALGSAISRVLSSDHRIADVAAKIRELDDAGCSPILVFGASAIVDRGDVIPAAVVAAGGEVVHLGMPVDPGNLMMLGRVGGTPVVGVPSCARSPKLNGFDWVLQRILADLPVSAGDIMDMGAGGLLKEIPTRPSPRERPKPQSAPRIAGILLAAGRSSRMGGRNKLLVHIAGKPMVRHAAEALAASKVFQTVVVTGHEREKVEEALEGVAADRVANPHFTAGLASSLVAGLEAISGDADGVVVALGDMPLVRARDIDRLIAAFDPAERRSVCVPVSGGRRGNPVLWGRQHFAALQALSGDQGAKALFDLYAEEIVEVAFDGDGVLADFDTPESLKSIAGP
jgi:molybdenum cofactor cytidylyltransferase